MEPSLRLITYLVPSHPTELYECIAHFLEEELGVKASLLYESRDPVELFNNRPDPFALNEADIGTFLGADRPPPSTPASAETVRRVFFTP